MGKRITHTGLVEAKIKAGDRRKTYSGLLWIAENRGFKAGWVAHKFKEIFGGWPKPQSPVLPEPPESLLVEYLGNDRKRFVARRRRQEAKQGAAILAAVKNHEPFPFSGEGLET